MCVKANVLKRIALLLFGLMLTLLLLASIL